MAEDTDAPGEADTRGLGVQRMGPHYVAQGGRGDKGRGTEWGSDHAKYTCDREKPSAIFKTSGQVMTLYHLSTLMDSDCNGVCEGDLIIW